MHTYIHVYTNIYIHTYIQINSHTHTHTHAYVQHLREEVGRLQGQNTTSAQQLLELREQNSSLRKRAASQVSRDSFSPFSFYLRPLVCDMNHSHVLKMRSSCMLPRRPALTRFYLLMFFFNFFLMEAVRSSAPIWVKSHEKCCKSYHISLNDSFIWVKWLVHMPYITR